MVQHILHSVPVVIFLPAHAPIHIVETVDRKHKHQVCILLGDAALFCDGRDTRCPFGQVDFMNDVMGQGIIQKQDTILG